MNIPLMALRKTICHYKVDFKVHHNDGSVELHRGQGACNPGLGV